MDVGEIRELVRRPSRRMVRLWAVAGCALAVPIIWSVRESRLTREALHRAVAAEQAADRTRADMEQTRAQLQGRPPTDPAVRRSRHDDPREIERVRQLYEEIEGLSHLRDRVDQALGADRPYVPERAPAPAPP